MIFGRKKHAETERTLTGVRAVLCASHRDQVTGQIHGHTWEITAWFVHWGVSEATFRHMLNEQVEPYDHTCLPDRLAWGEALAKHIGRSINRGLDRRVCVQVDVNRTPEGIFARWEA